MADSALRGLVWVDFPLSTYLQIISRLALPAPYDIFFHAHEGGTGTCLGIGVPLSMGTQDGCVKEHTISPVRNVRRNYCPKAHVDSSRIWGYALCAWPGGPGTIGGRPTAYWNRNCAGPSPAHCRGGRPESVRTWHFFHGKDLGICMWPPRFRKPTSNAIRRPDPPPSRPLQRRGRIPHASGSPHMRTMGVSSYGSICRLWMARFYTVKVFQQAL